MTENGQSDDTDRDAPGILFIVDYDTDAERKRVEYLFNNWEEGDVKKPDGLVRLATGINQDELYEEIVSKVPAGYVESYQLEEHRSEVDPETIIIEQDINADRDVVEPFLEYILSKKKAVLQSAAQSEYEVYTKKGRAEVTYKLSQTETGTSVTIRISGYSQAPTFLAEFFKTELNDYSATQE